MKVSDEQIEKIYEFVIDTVTFPVPEGAPKYVEEESGLHGGKEDELT